MRSRLKTLTSFSTTVLAVGVGGCGNLTEQPQGEESIGPIELLASRAISADSTPISVGRTTASVTGSGGIGQVTIISLDASMELDAAPDAIAVGADGSAWYTTVGGKALRVHPDDTVDVVRLPDGISFSPAIVSDANGVLWLANWSPSPGIARIDPMTDMTALFAVPQPLARPTALAASETGDIWLVGGDRPIVGHVTMAGDVLISARETAPTPVTISGGGVAISSGGQVFVSDYAQGRIGRVHGTGFRWTDLGGSQHAPSGLAAGTDGAVWFVSLGSPYEVGRIDADGKLTSYVLPQQLSGASDKSASSIARGPDGAFWFTMPEAGGVGRVTPQGEIGFVQLDGQSLPRVLAFDARGRLWLTIVGGGIARIEFTTP